MHLKLLVSKRLQFYMYSTLSFLGEQAENVKTAVWVGDCFIFTTALNRLSYFVGGEIVTIAHLDRPIYLVNT